MDIVNKCAKFGEGILKGYRLKFGNVLCDFRHARVFKAITAAHARKRSVIFYQIPQVLGEKKLRIYDKKWRKSLKRKGKLP